MPRAPATTSSTVEAAPAPAGAIRIRLGGAVYDCRESETVLDALLRQGAPVAYSCRKGTCLTCVLRSAAGPVPPAAQEGLREALRFDGYFLPCLCVPSQNLEVVPPDDAAFYGRAVVHSIAQPTPAICLVEIEPATPLYYRAGQFINLRRDDGLVRSYSLASVPRLDRFLELHVRRHEGGAMCDWIFDALKRGDALDIQGPNGHCYYVPGAPEQNLLLIGTGSGLAPLIGIARDALDSGHRGAIRLYHGSRGKSGLYLEERLRALAVEHANFDYIPCLSGEDVPPGHRPGRAERAAFTDLADLGGWRVFLCGHPAMVRAAKKTAFIKGAALSDISGDAFELRELRREPRD